MNALVQPGIYTIPMSAYLADPCPEPSLSSGIASTLITQSARHAWFNHPRLNPLYERDESSASMDIGTLAHACLLEGGTDNVRVIDPANYPNANGKGTATGWTNKAIREARDAARSAGEIPMLLENYQGVREMVNAATSFIDTSEIAGIFHDGRAEQTIIWQEGAAWCRARADWLKKDRSLILDYKTTAGSAEPNSWIRQMLNMGYDMQALFYMRGLSAITEKLPNFVFLVQETAAPYLCSLVSLSPAMMDFAERKVNRAVGIWTECMERSEWPGYPSRICWAEPPAWAQRQLEEPPEPRNDSDCALQP